MNTPPTRQSVRSAIVVGAGLGGLGAGYRVTLLEKNERAGGKLNLVEAQGFGFDTGPSLITLPGVLAATLRAVGRRMQDYLTLTPIDPICRYTFAVSTRLDVSPNLPRLISELDRYATYNGSSPYRAPATLAMIPYIELAGGGWYIQGGLYRLAESLLAVLFFIDIQLNSLRWHLTKQANWKGRSLNR